MVLYFFLIYNRLAIIFPVKLYFNNISPNGRTYYWSFRDKAFHGFYADRFTLAGTAERLCKYYRQSPQSYREAFRSREGIDVSEDNFCCGIEPLQD